MLTALVGWQLECTRVLFLRGRFTRFTYLWIQVVGNFNDVRRQNPKLLNVSCFLARCVFRPRKVVRFERCTPKKNSPAWIGDNSGAFWGCGDVDKTLKKGNVFLISHDELCSEKPTCRSLPRHPSEKISFRKSKHTCTSLGVCVVFFCFCAWISQKAFYPEDACASRAPFRTEHVTIFTQNNNFHNFLAWDVLRCSIANLYCRKFHHCCPSSPSLHRTVVQTEHTPVQLLCLSRCYRAPCVVGNANHMSLRLLHSGNLSLRCTSWSVVHTGLRMFCSGIHRGSSLKGTWLLVVEWSCCTGGCSLIRLTCPDSQHSDHRSGFDWDKGCASTTGSWRHSSIAPERQTGWSVKVFKVAGCLLMATP